MMIVARITRQQSLEVFRRRCVAAALTVLGPPCVVGAQLAERTLVAVLAAPPAADSVWPGYILADRSWAITDRANSFIVSLGSAPSSVERRSVRGVPAARAGRVFWRAGALPGTLGTLDLAYPIGDRLGTAISVSGDVENGAGFLYHEAFHTFQRERFARDSVHLSTVQWGFTPEYAASVEVERRLLREALKADGSSRDRIAREVVAVRTLRSRITPSVIGAVEGAVERSEGMADYVRLHSMAAAFRKSKRWPATQVDSGLRLALGAINGSPDERLIRVRGYATGAALGILLDERVTTWKQQVEGGISPGDLLARWARLSAADADSIGSRALARQGYEAMLRARPAPWGILATMSVDEFLRLAPFRLVFEVDSGARVGFSYGARTSDSDSDVSRGIQRPAPGITMVPGLTRMSITDSTGILATIRALPVMLSVREAPGRTVVTVLLDRPPRVNGAVILPGTTVIAGVSIVGDGIYLTIEGRVTVTAGANSLIISPPR